MKDKILNALKSKTFFALAINIVIMALIIGVTAFSYDSADDFTILYISVSIITITIMILTTFCDNYRFIAVHSFEFQLFCTFSNSSLLCRFFFCYICFCR